MNAETAASVPLLRKIARRRALVFIPAGVFATYKAAEAGIDAAGDYSTKTDAEVKSYLISYEPAYREVISRPDFKPSQHANLSPIVDIMKNQTPTSEQIELAKKAEDATRRFNRTLPRLAAYSAAAVAAVAAFAVSVLGRKNSQTT